MLVSCELSLRGGGFRCRYRSAFVSRKLDRRLVGGVSREPQHGVRNAILLGRRKIANGGERVVEKLVMS